jgi:hypothetical protein
MVEKKREAKDQLQLYCRSLGHRVPFEYCRSMNTALPCRSILACWQSVFPVEEFIRNFYLEEEIRAFLQPAKPKILQIYDSLVKATGAKQNKEG